MFKQATFPVNWLSRAIFMVLAAAMVLGAPGSAQAQSGSAGGQTQTQLGYLTADVPKVLSDSDVAVYRQMFKLQRQRQRSDVAALVSKLDNDILMGHLIAVRLLHPYTKTPYRDLQAWLAKYNDHSPASKVYQLANIRKPRGARHAQPEKPVPSLARYSNPDAIESAGKRPPNTQERRRLLRTLKSHRINNRYSKALTLLESQHSFKLLGEDTWAQVSLKLARSMLNDGEFELAELMAKAVVAQSRVNQPEGLWISGLAMYQQDKLAASVGSFRRLAYSVDRNSRYFAKGAWWAGRVYEDMGRGSMSQVFYNLAAQAPQSFYGQLAAARVGKAIYHSWQEPRVKASHKQALFADPVIRRVIALVQIGEYGLAQDELKMVNERMPYGMDESLLAFSVQLSLPNTAMTLARNLAERDKVVLAGLYPETKVWAPRSGYKVSKAFLHAIMRQESAFNPYVVSRAGARGLMQLMPGTARYVRNKQGQRPYSQPALLNPAINMDLGQSYLAYLDEQFNGNMIHMIAAYNGGPGNVKKWIEAGMGAGDPILFIENIPFKETRNYVRHVLSNLWMYRHRFAEDTPGLTAMAEGRWPVQTVAAVPSAERQSRRAQ